MLVYWASLCCDPAKEYDRDRIDGRDGLRRPKRPGDLGNPLADVLCVDHRREGDARIADCGYRDEV